GGGEGHGGVRGAEAPAGAAAGGGGGAAAARRGPLSEARRGSARTSGSLVVDLPAGAGGGNPRRGRALWSRLAHAAEADARALPRLAAGELPRRAPDGPGRRRVAARRVRRLASPGAHDPAPTAAGR